MTVFLIRAVISTLLLSAGWKVYGQWSAARILRSSTGIADLQQAIRSDPDEPELHFRVGILHRDQLQYLNLAESRKHLETAVRLNPHNWQYWLELGRSYEFLALEAEAERAYLKAVELNPKSAAYRWRMGNFYLRVNKLSATIQHFKDAMGLDPSLRRSSLAMLWDAGVTSEPIENIWPDDAEARLMMVEFLVSRFGDGARRPPWDLLQRKWDKLLKAPPYPSIKQGAFYVQFLLNQNRYEEARTEWVRLADKNNIQDEAFQSRRNAIWNGDFETPIAGAAVDWRYATSDAYTIVQAQTEGVGSSTALRIAFRGKANLDFQDLKQQAIVERGKSYEFSYQFQCQEISTEQGVYFQILDGLKGTLLLETNGMRGSAPWTSFSGTFGVPPTTDVVLIELRRRPSRQIDNLIRGTLWLDSVALKPK